MNTSQAEAHRAPSLAADILFGLVTLAHFVAQPRTHMLDHQQTIAPAYQPFNPVSCGST